MHAVTASCSTNGCDITEHQQFDDSVHGHLFLRTAFDCDRGDRREQLEAAFAAVADSSRHDLAAPTTRRAAPGSW